MEEVKNFAGGMHSDYSLQNQPEGTYRYARNFIRTLDGSMTSEMGTTPILGVPNKEVLHSFMLGDTLVLFFYNDEIGYLQNGRYYSVVKSASLEFSKESLPKARGRVDYRGHRIVYFVDGKNPNRYVDLDRDYRFVGNLSNELKLQLDSSLPTVDVVSVDNNGSLPTGVYQFQARLLTSSTNYSIPSLMTNPIPIVNEVGNSQQVDGAPPQTSSFKSITISIDNIDRKFKFVEIIAITYVGITNTPVASVVGRKAITSSSTTFTYRSKSQDMEEVTIDELTIDSIIYTSGRHIEYKDGRLLITGVTSRKENGNFQRVANSAKVYYEIKEVDYSEVIDVQGTVDGDIEDRGTSTHLDGYHKEVFASNYKGWQRNEVYDIAIVPEYTNGTIGSAYHIPSRTTGGPASTDTKLTGGYISDNIYPSGLGYPSGNIRFHVMPTASQEPIVRDGKIRVLGIRVEADLSILPESERVDIRGYIVVRQRRSEGNRKILAQGIAQPLVKTGRAQELLMVSPFTGQPHYRYDYVNTSPLDPHKYMYDHVAFYSPETIIGGDVPMADKMERVGWVEGTAYLAGYKVDEGSVGEEKFANIFIDYDKHHYPTMEQFNTLIDKSTIQSIPAEQPLGIYRANNLDYRVSTFKSNGFLLFKTIVLPVYRVDPTSPDYPKGDLSYNNKTGEDDDVVFYIGGEYHHQDASPMEGRPRGESKRVIFNLVSDSKVLYGDLSQAEYIYVGRGNSPLFNGDTFINRTSILSATAEVNESGETNDVAYRTLSYLFLESMINTTYRHFTTPNGEETGTVPYYPKSKTLWSFDKQDGLFQVDPSLGHSIGYNKQYSFDNGLKRFFPTPLLLEEEVSSFTNRVIVSELSLEGEQYDANRVFLPNSYHDIPKNKGTITDVFIHNNTLYFHTPQTLWRSFFNENTVQATSSGDVVLGNGGVFPRPSIEVFTLPGGYAGTSSSSGINTPFGRIFIDERQGKVFMLGESFEEISMSGMEKYFKGNLEVLSETLREGYTSTYDYLNRRFLLSKKGQWTISYTPELKSWSSFHNYYPNLMLSSGNTTYLFKDQVYTLGTGTNGNFMGTDYDVSLDVIFNQSVTTTKVFDNIVTQSTEAFSGVEVSTNKRESGWWNIYFSREFDEIDQEGFLPCKYRNEQYQFSLPRAEDESRFRDKYIKVSLTKSLNPPPFTVRYIKCLFRVNSR